MQVIFTLVISMIWVGCSYSQDTLPPPGVCGISVVKPKATSRIVNGEAAVRHSRPYQLLLVGFFPNGTAKFYCGASLIKPTHVLTAAHCVVGNLAENLRIFPGLHEFNSHVFKPENGVPIQTFVSHESYNGNSLANDVAVIRLRIPLEVDNLKIGLVCLATSASEPCAQGQSVVASGWGSTTGNPNRTSASRPVELQQISLQCVEGSKNADCKRLTYILSIIQEKSKMCAYAENKAVCFGDSGGPLVREKYLSDGTMYYEQVGIMSGTIDCSFSKPAPDVYADVRYLSPWILKQVNALA